MLQCNCSADCSQKTYEVDITSSVWPAQQYEMLAARSFILSAGAEMEDRSNDTSTEDDALTIANNLLKLNVYFESKMTKFIEETMTYDTVYGADFLNALGGALSLFLGISFILIFELLELLLDLLMNLVNFCLRKPLGRKYHLL